MSFINRYTIYILNIKNTFFWKKATDFSKITRFFGSSHICISSIVHLWKNRWRVCSFFQHKKKIPAGRQKFLSKFQQLHTRFLNKSVTIVLDQSHIVEWVTAVPAVKHYENLPYWNSISHISCNSIWSHIWFHKYFSNYKNI